MVSVVRGLDKVSMVIFLDCNRIKSRKKDDLTGRNTHGAKARRMR
jgi:hypothetical protein